MTLLEVLVAMTVLALGVFMAAALQVRGLQASDNTWREGQALQLLQGMLERVRARGAVGGRPGGVAGRYLPCWAGRRGASQRRG
jgi:type IV pilus modification protein PilV